MLDCPRVLAVVGELVAAAVPQHVAVNEEREARGLASPCDHALIASHAQRRQALRNKHVDAPGRLTLQTPQGAYFLPADRMHASSAALGPTDVQFAGSEIDVIPAQGHELG